LKGLAEMGTATGNYIKRLKGTGRGSDHYGKCDQCGKPMSECFTAKTYREYRRESGELYYGTLGGGAYGHEQCLSRFGPFDQVTTGLPGNV
jgi:hypothetical protein